MKKFRVAAVFLAAVLASGCMSVSTDAHISKNAEIEKVDYKVEINKDTYDMMTSMGNSTQSDQFTEENDIFNYSEYDRENYTEEDNKVFEVTFYDVQPKEGVNVSAYKEGEQVVFEDPKFALASMDQQSNSGLTSGSTTQFSAGEPKDSTTQRVQLDEGSTVQESNTTNSFGQGSAQGLQQMSERMKDNINITYAVHMPGSITNTTGEIEDGNKAVYNMTDMQSQEEGVYVKSKVSEGGIVSSVVSFFTGLI